MIKNQKAIEYLINSIDKMDDGTSSHWMKFLNDFKYVNGKFIGKWLPEGDGREKKTKIHDFLHFILQHPYRVKGMQFKNFKYLLKLTEKIHLDRDNKISMGTIRQTISLAFLDEKLNLKEMTNPIVNIGDGFGFMSCLLLKYINNSKMKVVLINLTKNLLIDAVSINKSLPEINIALINNQVDYKDSLADKSINCILIQADNARLISNDYVDLVINIHSMQEMNPNIVKMYFDIFRASKNSDTYFYCENRVEKKLPDGTISNFFQYPWSDHDEILVDRLCPWSQKYYSFMPPFYFSYDGPIQHRLVKLNK